MAVCLNNVLSVLLKEMLGCAAGVYIENMFEI